MLLDLAKLFCQSTSIRGVGKIFKAPTIYLRGLWLIYVLLMLFALIFSTTNIFMNYLEYNTVIQTSWALNDSSSFPDITFCSHHPFSGRAKTYWSDETIMSPTKWNKILRKRIRDGINRQDITSGIDSFLDDSKRMYYQNLSPNDSDAIGHQEADIILFCVVHKSSFLLVGKPADCDVLVKKISIAKYFNCFTIQSDPRSSHAVKRLILVLNVRDKPSYEHYEQAFVTDIFEQAHGVRMVIHEPNSYPDVEARGDQVEPGKLVEVSYQPINVKEIKTPKRPCLETEDEHPLIKDMNLSYNYSFEACMSLKTSEEYYRRCNCFFVDYLRPGVPNGTHPYCGETIDTSPSEFRNRRKCMAKVAKSIAIVRNELESTVCLRRCNYYRYSARTSITKWRPTQWQVHWVRQQLSALLLLYKAFETTANISETEVVKARQDIYEYTDSENLTHINTKGDNKSFMFTPNNVDDFVYIVVSRQDSPVMLETNKLTLELNGLVSRIGGLCSLYLGLTCAFGVELIEYLYLIKQKCTGGSKPETEEKEQKQTNHVNNDHPGFDEYYADENRRNSPAFSPSKRGFDYGFRDTVYRNNEEESPWSPRIPLNATSL